MAGLGPRKKIKKKKVTKWKDREKEIRDSRWQTIFFSFSSRIFLLSILKYQRPMYSRNMRETSSRPRQLKFSLSLDYNETYQHKQLTGSKSINFLRFISISNVLVSYLNDKNVSDDRYNADSFGKLDKREKRKWNLLAKLRYISVRFTQRSRDGKTERERARKKKKKREIKQKKRKEC